MMVYIILYCMAFVLFIYVIEKKSYAFRAMDEDEEMIKRFQYNPEYRASGYPIVFVLGSLLLIEITGSYQEILEPLKLHEFLQPLFAYRFESYDLYVQNPIRHKVYFSYIFFIFVTSYLIILCMFFFKKEWQLSILNDDFEKNEKTAYRNILIGLFFELVLIVILLFPFSGSNTFRTASWYYSENSSLIVLVLIIFSIVYGWAHILKVLYVLRFNKELR